MELQDCVNALLSQEFRGLLLRLLPQCVGSSHKLSPLSSDGDCLGRPVAVPLDSNPAVLLHPVHGAAYRRLLHHEHPGDVRRRCLAGVGEHREYVRLVGFEADGLQGPVVDVGYHPVQEPYPIT